MPCALQPEDDANLLDVSILRALLRRQKFVQREAADANDASTLT